MKRTASTTRKTGRPLSFDRDSALEKAMLSFWQNGYETTSISDLTAAMGITAPSLYNAFGDKKRLFLEAMHRYAGPIDKVEQFLTEAPTARDAAHGMLIAAAELFTGKTTPRGCLLASAAASGSENSADVKAEVALIRRQITDLLRKRIERDVALGILPEKTLPSSLATMVIALVQGMSVLARDGIRRDALKAMIETGMQAWPRET